MSTLHIMYNNNNTLHNVVRMYVLLLGSRVIAALTGVQPLIMVLLTDKIHVHIYL